MSNSYFRFKQFAVRQEKAAMKVGTDGVLLGAWVDATDAQTALDVGTGTGLIALMLAQKSTAYIEAVEIDTPSSRQAEENVKRSPWSNRIKVFNIAFQEFALNTGKKFDLIVSNPPYFIESLKSPEHARTTARHAELLSHDDLLKGVVKLINDKGRFAGIFPYVEGNVFTAKAANYGLYCAKRVTVIGKEHHPPKRLLLEFGHVKTYAVESTLCIRLADISFSDEYRLLTKDFYLAF